MQKQFGYPQYNQDDEKILTTYKGEYSDMLMDIKLKKLSEGEEIVICKNEEETAVLLQNGNVDFTFNDKMHNATREDVFSQGPYCVHVCKNTKLTIKALKKSQILIQSTHNDNEFDAKIYMPKDAPWIYSGKNLFGNMAKRRVNTIFDYESAPYSNMVIGEVINDRGNWSSYIPHSHPQPEVYYFEFDRPEGFGASFVGDDVYKIKHGSFSAITGGLTHPQAVAPGYLMYTCWMIRHLDNNPWNERIDDEEYTWLYNVKFED